MAPTAKVLRNLNGLPGMKLSFDDFTSITFAESPKEMVEWAEGIIQQVTKVFGEQDDWANDLHLSHG